MTVFELGEKAYVPAGHGMQALSRVEPRSGLIEPGGHVWQAAAPVIGLYESAGHGRQRNDPLVENEPAAQERH